MPRDLSDVLDYFLPAAEQSEEAAIDPHDTARSSPSEPLTGPVSPGECLTRQESGAGSEERSPGRQERPAALPIIAVPIGERDVVRAAYAWNLAVEVARMGAASTLIAPAEAYSALVWPEPGTGPVGCEMVLASVAGIADLNRSALDIAVSRAAECNQGGVVFVHVPPEWLDGAHVARGLLRWSLLFSTPERRDQLETYGLAKRLLEAHPDLRIGITIHGVRRVAEAEKAFQRVADVAVRRLGQSLLSYGLLVDDLHVYRAIVARRPIGLEHPQSRATRALQDVARMLLDDARKNASA